jgi:hypothetical protein
MKIGLSYSRCLIDLIENRVELADVLVIVTRTDFDPKNDSHWESIWEGYSQAPVWRNYQKDEQTFRALTIQLQESGRLHQPRSFGAYPDHIPNFYWLDTTPVSTELIAHPAVQSAWDNYTQTVALCK